MMVEKPRMCSRVYTCILILILILIRANKHTREYLGIGGGQKRSSSVVSSGGGGSSDGGGRYNTDLKGLCPPGTPPLDLNI